MNNESPDSDGCEGDDEDDGGRPFTELLKRKKFCLTSRTNCFNLLSQIKSTSHRVGDEAIKELEIDLKRVLANLQTKTRTDHGLEKERTPLPKYTLPPRGKR